MNGYVSLNFLLAVSGSYYIRRFGTSYIILKTKSTHGGVLLLVKLQAFGNLVKSNTAPWVFFMLFKLCKWHQIAQSITNSVLPAKELSYLYLSLTP